MTTQTIDEFTLFVTPNIFKNHPDLIAGQSTRHGGLSKSPYDSLNLSFTVGDDHLNVSTNRKRLCGYLGIDTEQLVTGTQIHGSACLNAIKAGHYEGYDAFITNRRNLFLCVSIADCVPILVYDPIQKVVAAIHAGWKSTKKRIVAHTLSKMATDFETKPQNCLAYIGTSIKVSDYEVGEDVAMNFDKSYLMTTPTPMKWLLDLPKANMDQLLEAGLKISNIEQSKFSTFRDQEHFFSYRYSWGKTGRMMAIIGLK